MKSFVLTLVVLVCTLGCAAQTMFFNKLDSTTWLSAPGVTDSTVKQAKQIPLGKWKLPKDSIKEDVTVWAFKAGQLTISYFNIQQKTETVILTYRYSINHDKGILSIYTNNTVHNFIAGITSTGNNVLLIQKKIKKSSVNKP
ncbi:MAG: hypothetical protein V4643_11710 [Bacteroidota bacterium]